MVDAPGICDPNQGNAFVPTTVTWHSSSGFFLADLFVWLIAGMLPWAIWAFWRGRRRPGRGFPVILVNKQKAEYDTGKSPPVAGPKE